MRNVFQELSEMGPLPALNPADESLDEVLNHYGDLLDSIQKPITDEEAKVLLALFGPDDAGGLVWTIIHAIETAPTWPMKKYLESLPESQWIDILKERAINAGIWE